MNPIRREALGRVILSLVVWASPAAAQFSFTPRPAPEARWFLVTEFGAVLNLNRVEASSREQLLNWELGPMLNLNPKCSLGATLFLSYSKDAEIYAGPKLRFRYWINRSLSFDAGAGPVWRLNYIESGTWLSGQVGLSYRDLAHVFVQFDFFEDTIASAGIKIGRLPGAIIGAVAGGIAGIRFLVSRLD